MKLYALKTVQVWLSPFYAAEVQAAANNLSNSALKPKALEVANIPTFTWFDQVAKVPMLATYLQSASQQQNSSGQKVLVQMVVYDLPDRDCSALASNGEFTIADNGLENYINYINGLADAIQGQPDVRVVAIIEPDSLANLVTNLQQFPKCANAEQTYLNATVYALQKLNMPNVFMYLDAGHAGWLGWPNNLAPAAQLFSQVYTSAGKPSQVRGLATSPSSLGHVSPV